MQAGDIINQHPNRDQLVSLWGWLADSTHMHGQVPPCHHEHLTARLYDVYEPGAADNVQRIRAVLTGPEGLPDVPEEIMAGVVAGAVALLARIKTA